MRQGHNIAMRVKEIIKRILGVQKTWRFLRSQYVARRDAFMRQRALARRKKKVVDSSRILAFWGSDYVDLTSARRIRDASSLWHFIAEGYTLLPLDLSAMQYITATGLQCVLRGDILPEEEAAGFVADADALWSGWLAACGASAEYGGVNWLREDYASLRWSIKGACYAARMAKALRRKGTRKFVYIEYASKRPGPYYYRSDVGAHVWGALLGPCASPLVVSGPPAEVGKSFTDPPTVQFPEGDTLVAVNPAEMERFFPFVVSLAQAFPQKTCLCLFGQDQKSQEHWQKRTALPVALMPFPEASTGDMFEDCLTTSRIFFESLEWGPGFDWFLRYHTHTRWPTLCRWLTVWRESLMHWRGHSVVGSFLEDLESKIPLAAALAAGKNTCYIPHGFVQMPRRWGTGWPPATMLCPTVLQEDCIKEALPHLATQLCPQLDLREEYPTEIITSSRKINSINVLVILAGLFVDDAMMPLCGDSEYVEVLRILSSIQKYHADKINMKFKSHPGFPDDEIFKLLNIDEMLLPNNTRLEYNIKESDIVVMLNYWGAPCFFSMKHRKPVLFLSVNKLFNEHFTYYKYYLDKFYEFNLWIHNDMSYFMDAALKQFDDKDFINSVLANQDKFYDKYIKVKENVHLKKIFS